MRVTFFQRGSGGGPATGVTHSVTAADESGGAVTPPSVTEINASTAPGWYYFDLSSTGRVVVTTDAGGGISSSDRYQAFVVDPDSASTKTAVREAVWDAAASAHTAPGSFGETVSKIEIDTAAVPGAVWDEARAGHVAAGTFGEGLGFQVDSTLYWRLLSTTYSGSPARPTSLIIAAYPTKADADADTNRLYTQTVDQTFDATGQLVTSKKTRI